MKKFNVMSAVLSVVMLMSGLVGHMTVFAATDPSLGAAANFSVIAQTAITGTGTVSGDVGLNSTGAGITALTDVMVSGTIYSTDGVTPSTAILDSAVQANLATANGNISSQASTASIGPVLDGLIIAPGVYDIGAGRLGSGILTLDGSGIYILRASSDFVSSGSINLTNGARACDVYWQVNTLATIDGSSFVGTIIAGTGVHFGTGVALDGRALALGGDVTLLSNTISGPTCATPPVDSATLLVVKTVVNDNGGTKVISDFPLFIDGVSVISGVATSTTIGLHTVSETADSGYTSTIGGNCAIDGTITLALDDVQTCTITNDDIAPVVPPPSGGGGSGSGATPMPPLIDVVKVPSPLALPDGPGTVEYTYTLHNIGNVPVLNVTMVGDSCSPITLVSGDTDFDDRLDMNETWVYTCSTMLSETHTNIVTAIGWANGMSATDIASATVIVGVPVVPPLIHVTKVPNPLVLLAGGGQVTYTYKVTNPGTVALSNISLIDDKCSPVRYVSGDTDDNAKLDTAETWTYTCSTNLTRTTVNTVTASGDANGLTARDFAIVTVVVNGTVVAIGTIVENAPVAGSTTVVENAAVPKLPNTGLPPKENNTIQILVGILVISFTSYIYAQLSRKHLKKHERE